MRDLCIDIDSEWHACFGITVTGCTLLLLSSVPAIIRGKHDTVSSYLASYSHGARMLTVLVTMTSLLLFAMDYLDFQNRTVVREAYKYKSYLQPGVADCLDVFSKYYSADSAKTDAMWILQLLASLMLPLTMMIPGGKYFIASREAFELLGRRFHSDDNGLQETTICELKDFILPQRDDCFTSLSATKCLNILHGIGIILWLILNGAALIMNMVIHNYAFGDVKRGFVLSITFFTLSYIFLIFFHVYNQCIINNQHFNSKMYDGDGMAHLKSKLLALSGDSENESITDLARLGSMEMRICITFTEARKRPEMRRKFRISMILEILAIGFMFLALLVFAYCSHDKIIGRCKKFVRCIS